MKLGKLIVLFQVRPLEAVLDSDAEMGLQTVELGTGARPGNAHCDPVILLNGRSAMSTLRKMVEDRGLTLSGLSCPGNPLHPKKAFASEYEDPMALVDESISRAVSFLKNVLLTEQPADMWWV